MRRLLFLCGAMGGLFMATAESSPAEDATQAECAAAKAIVAIGGAVDMQGDFVASVDFRRRRWLTDDHLKQIIDEFKNCRNLRVLSFVGCDRLTGEGLTALLKERKSFQHLQTLLIGGTQTTDAILKEIKHLPELQHLGLTNDSSVSDAGLRELQGMKNLRRLVVAGTQATEKGIKELKKDLPRLEVVTAITTPADFDTIIEEMPAETYRVSWPRVSPHETIRATIDGNEMVITYGRPSKKHGLTGEIRRVWGHVVPYGEPWRTGADEATGFYTKLPIVIGRTIVPAGSYTLYTLPMKDDPSKLVISTRIAKLGVLGVPVDQNHDFVQIDMKREPLEKSVDRFTMAIEKTKTGGVLKLTWEKTQFSVPFTVKK